MKKATEIHFFHNQWILTEPTTPTLMKLMVHKDKSTTNIQIQHLTTSRWMKKNSRLPCTFPENDVNKSMLTRPMPCPHH